MMMIIIIIIIIIIITIEPVSLEGLNKDGKEKLKQERWQGNEAEIND